MDNNNNTFIRPLEISDLINVAQLHQKGFKESALTKLGQEPIRRYYEWLLLGTYYCYAIGYFEKNRILGFCFSGILSGSMAGYLAKNKGFLITWILLRPWLVFNPMVIDRINLAFQEIRTVDCHYSTTPVIKKKSFGVLAICVDPKKQGLGIGKTILSSIETEAIRQGYEQMHLTVHATNHKAIAFYEKSGWKKIPDPSGNWLGLMEKSLI